MLIHTGHFEKGVAEGVVDPSFNPVVALRLSVLKDSAVWAIVSEVSQSNTSPVNILSNRMTPPPYNTQSRYVPVFNDTSLCFASSCRYI